MNKREISVVVLLFCCLVGWGVWQRSVSKKAMAAAAAAATNMVETVESDVPVDTALETPTEPVVEAPVTVPDPRVAPEPPPVPESEPAVDERGPEARIVLSNDVAEVTLSSWGGAIVNVALTQFPETLEEDSGCVVLDFTEAPALAVEHVPGIGSDSEFTLSHIDGATNAVLLVGRTASGLMFRRTVALGEGHELTIRDELVNETGSPVALPRRGLRIGPMQMIETKSKTRGISYLGLDTAPADPKEDVRHWAKNGMFRKSPLFAVFKAEREAKGVLPDAVVYETEGTNAWVAAKNKFFAQVLTPAQPGTGCTFYATRSTEAPKGIVLNKVSAVFMLAGASLAPGESAVFDATYFVGPKKYNMLHDMGGRQAEIMEFGIFSPVCKVLLPLLNGIYTFTGRWSYGIAIIILTIIVKIVFWPVTHKSTESMKKMQAIQPQLAELKERHKDKPQRLQQETMALYKEHKVNPMMGCLPMLVQIPVFIALFTVLRSAVELRFAGFLWIADLSEPEGLLAGSIPFLGALNILPIFMTATMIWQQHLTPSAGDPQQKKMMMIMPIVMLFIFYNMASALVLYWSTSQCLSIVQLLLQKRRTAPAKA